MVSFSSLALLSLATVGSLAAPRGSWGHKSQCLSGADAQQVADNYAELIRDYSDKLANEALSVDFIDYSESVNTLIDTCPQGSAAQPVPLLSASFTNRAAFEKGQGQQPNINFKQLNLEYNCQTITLRWETTNTAPIPSPRPVVGIILLEVEKAPSGNKYPWIIKEVFSEFDSGAWLQNLEEAGICSVTESGSPTVIIPASSGAPVASTYAASTTAAASTYAAATSAAASSWQAASSQAAASSYAASSQAAQSSYAASPSTTYAAAASSTAAAYSTASYN